ncbi:hypothetical protein B0I71DRAFT_8249 [Yarrowia lipolytica]|uniref:Uncharacterized protein n=1 Tax=Yarrowia lipolytica TaxID=4952 RepID=A0A371C0I3_YARLL|nr:hypothetical protein B0I71DRAFT_8249 [Yarrowia lipolytica]
MTKRAAPIHSPMADRVPRRVNVNLPSQLQGDIEITHSSSTTAATPTGQSSTASMSKDGEPKPPASWSTNQAGLSSRVPPKLATSPLKSTSTGSPKISPAKSPLRTAGPRPSAPSGIDTHCYAATEHGTNKSRDALVSEMLWDYLSGNPILHTKVQKVRHDISNLKMEYRNGWHDPKMIMHLFDMAYDDRGKHATDFLHTAGHQLQLIWTFDPTLTRAMEQTGDGMKDIIYCCLAIIKKKRPSLTLSEVVRQIINAMPQRIDGLTKCMNLAVDVAKKPPSPGWEELMIRSSRHGGLLSLRPNECEIVADGLQVLCDSPWPQMECVIIGVVEIVMSKTQNKFTPTQIIQDMMRLIGNSKVSPILGSRNPYQLQCRLQATLLALKFMEPLLFSLPDVKPGKNGKREKNEEARAPIKRHFSEYRPNQLKRSAGPSNATDVHVSLTSVGKPKLISPRKLRTLEIETKLAEMACKRTIRDFTGVTPSVKAVQEQKTVATAPRPRKPAETIPTKLSLEDGETANGAKLLNTHEIARSSTTEFAAESASGVVSQSRKSLFEDSKRFDLSANMSSEQRINEEIGDLLDNVSSNEPLIPPAQTTMAGVPSVPIVERLHAPTSVCIKEESKDIAFRNSAKLSVTDAVAKIAHLQPGVGKYIESIQGHDPHVAKAFLVRLVMSGQVDVGTTLGHVKQLKIRYPRHEFFFSPKDDKLLLQLMRGAGAKPSKLNRLFKRHLSSDIDMRMKFLGYLKTRKDN